MKFFVIGFIAIIGLMIWGSVAWVNYAENKWQEYVQMHKCKITSESRTTMLPMVQSNGKTTWTTFVPITEHKWECKHPEQYIWR